jgi:aryl-alcohol dehydrogenase-like predicted oxidoreductase
MPRLAAAIVPVRGTWRVQKTLARGMKLAGLWVRDAPFTPVPGTVASMPPLRHGEPSMPMATLSTGGPAVSRIGLGLAALGRPAYITAGREHDLPDRSVAAMRDRTFAVLDAAYAAGIRYVDAARSYGRAEEFLGGWLSQPGHADLVVGSKWGYRYTGGWRLDADHQEVKEHSLAMFRTQVAESRALLGDRIALYQVHSLTTDSPLRHDAPLLAALGELRDSGVIVGLTTSGPRQADALRWALDVTVSGRPLFAAAQVTWNPLEPTVESAAAEAAEAGWAVIIKEALANGRLVPGGDGPGRTSEGFGPADDGPLARLAAERGVGEDAVALAAALANPWATVVLSGAVTPEQIRENIAALTVGDLPPLDIAEPPEEYWGRRGARPWH